MQDDSAARNAHGKLPKSLTGIDGFDDISHGGLPRAGTSLFVGGPGTGKTVFALQTLVNGIREHGEAGILIAFEENAERMLANAASFNWNLPALRRNKLFVIDGRLQLDEIRSGTFDLGGLLAVITAKAKQMNARRVVFDGIDVLLSVLNDPVAERREMYRLHEWLQNSGMTGIVTAKTDPGEDALQRYGFMQFMADCVVLLNYGVVDRIAHRSIRVLKYRGSGFSANEFPMVISQRGIEVARHAPVEMRYKAYRDRVSTGIPRLDNMLSGGYLRGSSVLISGLPGTAKSTLSGAFTQAECGAGHRVLYVSFDEAGEHIVRNMTSVNIRLDRFVKSGRLRILSLRSEAVGTEEHYLRIQSEMAQFKPDALIIDPISAIMKCGNNVAAADVVTRLLAMARLSGTTMVCTALIEGSRPDLEATPAQISTIADAWIHLSYVIRGGERNRALTIVKARGTRHSNQVRELVLSDRGVTLTDVYSAGGEVLMGTARWEREAEQQASRERDRIETARKRRDLELAEVESEARLRAIRRESHARKAELSILKQSAGAQESAWLEERKERERRRGVDARNAARPKSRRIGGRK